MLILACAPLGNPGDATTRLREVIVSAKFIAAEDSRKLTRLAHDLGVVYTGKVISYFEGNESERLDQLTEILESGEDLLVITDAGARDGLVRARARETAYPAGRVRREQSRGAGSGCADTA